MDAANPARKKGEYLSRKGLSAVTLMFTLLRQNAPDSLRHLPEGIRHIQTSSPARDVDGMLKRSPFVEDILDHRKPVTISKIEVEYCKKVRCIFMLPKGFSI